MRCADGVGEGLDGRAEGCGGEVKTADVTGGV